MQDKHDFLTTDMFSCVIDQQSMRESSTNAERSRRDQRRAKEKQTLILQEDIYCAQKQLCQAR